MAKCNSCSAPLPANINRCVYCNVRNDVDLHGKNNYTVTHKLSNRICPHCIKPLQTIKLDLEDPFSIERCKSCFGLFFDPGEIETLLESSVSNVFDINLSLIQNINQDRYKKHLPVKYIKCPVCETFMNRVNFGHQSGVIVDQCRMHGIWLDNGEITHLMEWKKAGGQLLDSKNKAKQTKTKKQKTIQTNAYDLPIYREQNSFLDADLLESLSSLVFKLFR